VHLVGVIIRIYHEPRSPERQRRLSSRLYSHFQESGCHYTEKITIIYIYCFNIRGTNTEKAQTIPDYALSDLGKFKKIKILNNIFETHDEFFLP
jgi:hypothetical protein